MAGCETGHYVGEKLKKGSGVFEIEALNEEGLVPADFVADPDAACVIGKVASRNYQDLTVGQAGITMGTLICERCGMKVQIGLRRIS